MQKFVICFPVLSVCTPCAMHAKSLKAQKTTKDRVESLRKKLEESIKHFEELCGKFDMELPARTEAKVLCLYINRATHVLVTAALYSIFS